MCERIVEAWSWCLGLVNELLTRSALRRDGGDAHKAKGKLHGLPFKLACYAECLPSTFKRRAAVIY